MQKTKRQMSGTGIVFPHQLFEASPLLTHCREFYLAEEYLFFRQYNFHKQKITLHRAGMKFYTDYLKQQGKQVTYFESSEADADIRQLIKTLAGKGIKHLHYIDPTDEWLEKRLTGGAAVAGIQLTKHASPMFLNHPDELEQYYAEKKKLFQTDFYKVQRVSRNILMAEQGKPVGNKWTFDDENRLKYPANTKPPRVQFYTANDYITEARQYSETRFAGNYGVLNPLWTYPCTFEESKNWLRQFLQERFAGFGAYEDALVTDENILHHSLLTPMLNTGLLTPQYIVDETLSFAANNPVPLNSLEGFIRQIIGWREFIRMVYQLKGTVERNRNYWNFTRKIPASFWNATTGIAPLDLTIKKVLETGYCHHIERLMVLGNFMLLCEFDPDDVYRWFMELFIDAYDWVMVPNVYGMSQFADGGLMATKPYISGSNYLMKMSDFKKGNWQKTWDALFWRFMHVHRNFFLTNPRLGMLVKTFEKMDHQKQQLHLMEAERFLSTL